MASDRHLAQLLNGAAAWNRWRREEPLVRPDLQGLSLTLAQKQWGQTNGGPINFAQSLLREADLRHATLIDADLSGAALVGADLSGARMRNANLRNANLAHARFNGADLEGARFEGADLSGADLGEARNLRSSQIAVAHTDASTLLPRELTPQAGPHKSADAEAQAPVAPEVFSAPPTEAYFPSVLRAPERQGDPFANRFGRALHGLSRPRLDTAAVQARRSFNELPRPRLDSVATRLRQAFDGLPRPRVGAALKRVPRPADLSRRAGLALSGLPYPKMLATAGIAGVLLVFGFGVLLALRSIDDGRVDTASRTAVAEEQVAPEQDAAGGATGALDSREKISSSTPAQEEEPQRLTVTEAAETTPVQDMAPGQPDGTVGARVDERPPAPQVDARPLEPSADSHVRLAFTTRAEDVTDAQDKSLSAPLVGSEAQAFIESYIGQPVVARSLDDTMQRTDLPTPKSLDKPTAVAKLPDAKLEPEPALAAPTSMVEYLSRPNKSSDWIKVFIEHFYLSGEALNEADLRRIYSRNVDYFGEPKTSLDKVAREKARYYRDWPRRHYELVSGSIDIKWKSDQVADVSFVYDYRVSAPKKKVSKGRGRAHLTFDLRGHTGLIVREDGEVIAHN